MTALAFRAGPGALDRIGFGLDIGNVPFAEDRIADYFTRRVIGDHIAKAWLCSTQRGRDSLVVDIEERDAGRGRVRLVWSIGCEL